MPQDVDVFVPYIFFVPEEVLVLTTSNCALYI